MPYLRPRSTLEHIVFLPVLCARASQSYIRCLSSLDSTLKVAFEPGHNDEEALPRASVSYSIHLPWPRLPGPRHLKNPVLPKRKALLYLLAAGLLADAMPSNGTSSPNVWWRVEDGTTRALTSRADDKNAAERLPLALLPPNTASRPQPVPVTKDDDLDPPRSTRSTRPRGKTQGALANPKMPKVPPVVVTDDTDAAPRPRKRTKTAAPNATASKTAVPKTSAPAAPKTQGALAPAAANTSSVNAEDGTNVPRRRRTAAVAASEKPSKLDYTADAMQVNQEDEEDEFDEEEEFDEGEVYEEDDVHSTGAPVSQTHTTGRTYSSTASSHRAALHSP